MPDAPSGSPDGLPDAAVGFGRRLAGVAIDWLLCLIIASAFLRAPGFDPSTAGLLERSLWAGNDLGTVAVWAVQHLVLVATLGTTIGHRIVGLRVVRADGSTVVGLVPAAIRTVLAALILPAILTDREGAGYHDALARTRLIRVRRGAL